MSPLLRWCVVALLVVAAVGVPVVVRAWPVGDSDVSAADLLARVQAAGEHPYSGYVETTGTIKLPVGDQFSDLGALVGGPSRLRVWWRDAAAWRVDRLETTGENDTIRDRRVTTTYDYASARATSGIDPAIRLPRAADLVPPALARTVLDGVTAGEVSRLPTTRVAGIAAPGLRVDPSSPLTSVDHVDLWADPSSGVPLRVEVYAAGSGTPAFSTVFREFSAATPGTDLTSFTPSAGVEQQTQDVLDIADAANQYAPLRPPSTVAGLTRSSGGSGAVGVYGRGVTRFIAIPLRDGDADTLRDQLAKAPGVRTTATGTLVAVGPLGVYVTGQRGDGQRAWAVAGTVTPATLQAAGADLVRGSIVLEDAQ
jgi:hypothetical protein